MLHTIAVDIGASNGRVMVGDYDGNQLYVHEVGRFTNNPVNLAGGLYWNVLSLYDSIRNTFCICKREGLKLSSIAFDTWAQDFGLVSQGMLLANPHHYRDPYTEGQVHKASLKMSQHEQFDIIATHAFQGSTFYQLLAIKEKYACLLDCSEHLLFMPNLFTYFTSGIISCDCTIASFSQMYDIYQNTWSSKIRTRYDLPDIIPSVQLPGQIIGKTDREFYDQTGYQDIPVVLAAGHDTASAAFAVLGNDENTLVVSSGTWSMMVANTAKPITSFRDTGIAFYNALGANGKHVLIQGVTGLWILQQCMKQWKTDGLTMTYAELEQYALKHDSDSWFVIDDLELSQTQNMCQTVATLCMQNGYTPPDSPQALYTVIMHSLARKYSQVFQEFETTTGKEYKNIYIIGGGARDQVLCALTAMYSHRNIVVGPSEATVIGNILMQLVALGEIAIEEAQDLAITMK